MLTRTTSWSLILTMMHELIDREYPVCLYCGKRGEVFFSGSAIPSSALTIEHESLQCISCKETFTINSIQNSNGETNYTGFDLSCNEYIIGISYTENYYEIRDDSGNYIVTLPPFKIDFSDKEKLYQKIKTYVLFS